MRHSHRRFLTYRNVRRQTRFGLEPFSFGFRLFRCFDPDVQKYLSTNLPSRSWSGPSQPRQSRGQFCVAGASMRTTRYSALQIGQRNFVMLSNMDATIARGLGQRSYENASNEAGLISGTASLAMKKTAFRFGKRLRPAEPSAVKHRVRDTF